MGRSETEVYLLGKMKDLSMTSRHERIGSSYHHCLLYLPGTNGKSWNIHLHTGTACLALLLLLRLLDWHGSCHGYFLTSLRRVQSHWRLLQSQQCWKIESIPNTALWIVTTRASCLKHTSKVEEGRFFFWRSCSLSWQFSRPLLLHSHARCSLQRCSLDDVTSLRQTTMAHWHTQWS